MNKIIYFIFINNHIYTNWELFSKKKNWEHSKIKNTGIIFELLTRQITADVLNGKDSKAVTIVKKYFNENTSLGKELHFIVCYPKNTLSQKINLMSC